MSLALELANVIVDRIATGRVLEGFEFHFSLIWIRHQKRLRYPLYFVFNSAVGIISIA